MRETTTFRSTCRVRGRTLLGLTLAVGLATVPPIVIPATAQAATHRANLTEACKQQYHKQSLKLRHIDDVQQQVTLPGNPSADQYHNPNRATPYGYYCVETILSRSLGIPSGAEAQVVEQEVGDLNVQIYCDKNYPGSKARGNFDADKTWDCVN